MSKTSQEHKELRKQNKADLMGLYIFTGILLLALIIAIISTIF